jgi:predicted PurR-regulated permease PerM
MRACHLLLTPPTLMSTTPGIRSSQPDGRDRRHGAANDGSGATHQGLTRTRLRIFALLALTVLALAGCAALLWPFVPALAWALALGVLIEPLHATLARRLRRRDVSAGLCVLGAAVILLGPAAALVNAAAQQLADVTGASASVPLRSWEDVVSRLPAGPTIIGWIERHFDIEREWQRVSGDLATRVTSLVTGTLWMATQFLIMLFTLFYFLRDGHAALATLRRYSPLSEHETDHVFTEVAAMIDATVYGTLVVAAVQGCLGGLMFWWLGVPAPILWGLVMALLSLFPMAGSFLVWFPTAVVFALQGDWTRALVLVLWGAIAIGLIDNLLYPSLVGREMRLHTLPVFFAIVGGVLMIGASGIILGPVLLALTVTLFDVWRARTVAGRPAEASQP